jgi:hypothetical protein
MVIYAISDLEGFHPSELIPNFKDIISKDEVIICGDVLDSTMISKPKHIDNKSNNLRTLCDIVTKPNLRLTFGNRDLNKMKVLPLTILTTTDKTSSWLIDNFNNGTIKLDFLVAYTELKKITHLEWVHKMSNWYPFWGGKIGEKIEYWKNDNEPSQYGFFEKRFRKIFGDDTIEGTMSAVNLLETIPKELKLYNSENNDFNAFVVLAVFRAMLQKINIQNTSKAVNKSYSNLTTFLNSENYTKVTQLKLNQSMFRGLLYNMFLDPKNNMIIQKCDCPKCCRLDSCECPIDNNMYLFSHGGVSNNIILENTLVQLEDALKKSTKLKEKLTNAQNISQLGGYYIKQENEKLEPHKIDTKIKSFNEKMKQTISAIFGENHTEKKVPSDNMLLLLIASATFDCKSYIGKIKGDLSMCISLDKSSDILSTMTGIRKLRQERNMFYKKGNLFNIFGHNPNGFFSTIDLFENGDSKTYLINLDTSNTFLTTEANAKSSSYLKIDGSNVSIHSNVNIKAKEDEILVNENPIELLKSSDESVDAKIISFTNKGTRDSFIKGELSNILIDNQLNKLNEHIKLIGENKNIFYHGFTTKDGKKYILLTYHNLINFQKCLVILSEDDFKRIFSDTKKGGAYLHKYLKYKQKYISLKNQLEL